MRILVTGGAGFIGSHLVDSLIESKHDVIVFDNLSSGDISNVSKVRDQERFRFMRRDLKVMSDIQENLNKIDLIFHLAANPEVRVGEVDPSVHFNENMVATFNLLEGMRRSRSNGKIVFTSTSTIYGEAKVLPTPEDYGRALPISTYGASKLGCEALISSYSYTFCIRGLILRLANIVGARSKHGIITDFIRKLKQNPRELEILGNGHQEKSYLHVEDCVSAIRRATDIFLIDNERVCVYNIGSFDTISVGRIAEIVVEEMGLTNVHFNFTGGVDGGRGWLGDVKNMTLDITKLTSRGWKPRYNSEESVRLAVRETLLNERYPISEKSLDKKSPLRKPSSVERTE